MGAQSNQKLWNMKQKYLRSRKKHRSQAYRSRVIRNMRVLYQRRERCKSKLRAVLKQRGKYLVKNGKSKTKYQNKRKRHLRKAYTRKHQQRRKLKRVSFFVTKRFAAFVYMNQLWWKAKQKYLQAQRVKRTDSYRARVTHAMRAAYQR